MQDATSFDITHRELQSRAIRAGYRPQILDRARILVVGAGALGQNVLLDLALSGVRDIRIVDPDRFEPHNATRSPLFDREAVANDPDPSKARLCALALSRIATHPDAEVRFADCWIQDLGHAAFGGVDLVVSAVDSARARLYLARCAMAEGLPFVEGGFSGPTLHLSVFPMTGDDPTRTACWACRGLPRDIEVSFPCGAVARAAALSGIVPALQNGAACLGAMVAEAAIQVLHGNEPRARRAQLDLRSLEASNSSARPSPGCAANHHQVLVNRASALGPEATAARVLAEALPESSHGGVLHLPRVFVVHGECRSCGAVLTVDSPQHRFVSDAWCTACGGPWPTAPAGAWPEVRSIIYGSDPDVAGLPLERSGVLPGDRVEILHPDGRLETVRLAGAAAWSLVTEA